jgi:SAM-dependent methyltransferase
MRSQWQIPEGVSPGTWDYVRNGKIAADYDQFLSGDPLTRLDWEVVSHCLPPVPKSESEGRVSVVEFGCGTGRTLIPLIERGYRAVGVDLSIPMLDQMRRNYFNKFGKSPEHQTLACVQANLVQLQGMAENSVDHGVCLFSTLGMIRGAKHRQKFLRHARRIIRDQGVFVLHAHNFWQQLTLPGGWAWFASHLLEVGRKKCELGDRFSNYRNVADMFIHSFRRRELVGVLRKAGFEVQAWHRVETQPWTEGAEGQQQTHRPRAIPVGWVVVCR